MKVLGDGADYTEPWDLLKETFFLNGIYLYPAFPVQQNKTRMNGVACLFTEMFLFELLLLHPTCPAIKGFPAHLEPGEFWIRLGG